MGSRGRRLVAIALVVASAAACTAPPNPPEEPAVPSGDDAVGLNQLQYLGTHNSYKVRPSTGLLLALLLGSGLLPGVAQGLDPAQLDYGHRPLDDQLDAGLRTFELDVFADPTGGRFAAPLAAQFLGQPFPAGVDEPGMKVLHIQEVDYLSTCPTLVACLTELRTWSDAHPDHLPITVNLELKSDALPAPFDVTPVVPFDAAQLAAVDAEVRSVLGDRLITPDDVRGGAPDLRTAVTTSGWPSVADARGRVLLFMDNADLRGTYLGLHPGLRGATLFTSSGFGAPDAAVLKVNDPGDGSYVRNLVQQGYLVRTRADSDVVAPSTVQRDAALASGAQLVHTDFPKGEPAGRDGYQVLLPTRVQARCNPVNTTGSTCTAAAAVEPLRP